MEAIWSVMRTGCPWRALDATTLCSSATVERRFREWRRAGVFERLHRSSPGGRARGRRGRLGLPGRRRAPRGGAAVAHGKRGPSRVDRRKRGSKWAAIVDRGGLALAVAGGDRHDLPPAREALTRLRVPPDARPGVFAADGAFDDAAFRAAVAALGVAADIPRNPRETGRPKHRGFVPGRWVVERAHAHLGAFVPCAPAGPACSTATRPSSPPPPRTALSDCRVVMVGSE
jgi:transposase